MKTIKQVNNSRININLKSVVILIITIFIVLFISRVLQKLIKENETTSSIAIVCMMKNPKNIDYWLKYHRNKGVNHFYLRLEDTPGLVNYLSVQPDVNLIVGSSNDKSSFSKEYDSQFARQRDLAKDAIKWCLEKNIKWLIHIDSDELVECDGKTISGTLENELQKEKGMSAEKIHTIIMDNYEAKYDKINGKNDSCFTSKKLINCKTEKGCVSYVNGKSIGRVTEQLRESGPHRFTIDTTSNHIPSMFTSNSSDYSDNKNNESEVKDYEFNSKKIRVLHFESCDFDKYVSKFIYLAKTEQKEYPFEFYNKSIELAKTPACDLKESEKCKNEFKKLYTHYKM